MRKLIIISLLILSMMFPVMAQNYMTSPEEGAVCSVYFTKIGCPACAKADPFVLGEWTTKHNNLAIIEYVITDWSDENSILMGKYNINYGTGGGVPLLILSKDDYYVGLSGKSVFDAEKTIGTIKTNPCLLSEGTSNFEDIDLNRLPGKTKIWYNGRVLVRIKEGSVSSDFLRELLSSKNLSSLLENSDNNIVKIKAEPAPISYGQIDFKKAFRINDSWILKCNDNINPSLPAGNNGSASVPIDNSSGSIDNINLTIPAILSLALADSVNPCAIAVLAFLLIAYMTNNPKDKRKTLLVGLSFISAVCILYMVYAVVIIGLLNLTSGIAGGLEGWMYGLFSLFAILLGCSNMKDFFWYKPGGLLTEMPMSWRPRVKKVISGIASPKGAFFVGIAVTLFLLPCTVGPLVTACVILEKVGIMGSLPWLVLYNLIFVLPMVVITFGIYAGLWVITDITEWKNKNIKYLHLAAGSVMVFIGLFMAWEAGNVFSIIWSFFELNFFSLGLIEIPLLAILFYLRRNKQKK